MSVGIQGQYTGILPPFVSIPQTGPTGVLPARTVGDASAISRPGPLQATGVMPPAPALPDRGIAPLSRVAEGVRQRIRQNVWPPVQPGGGYITGMHKAVRAMDVVNGMDQILGKTTVIMPSGWQAGRQKIIGNFSTREALGPMTGAVARAYG